MVCRLQFEARIFALASPFPISVPFSSALSVVALRLTLSPLIVGLLHRKVITERLILQQQSKKLRNRE